MKTLLALLVLTAASLCAQTETLDLGSRGRLTIYLPGDWRIDTTNFARQGSMTISPRREDVNASCTLVITNPESADRYDTKARLKLRVEADCHGMAEGSVEKRAVAREFTLTSGYGFYCSFTDPELRGQPPQKGNYKVMSTGKIRYAADVIVEVSIMADDFRGEPYQQLLGAVEGMEFAVGRGR